MKKQQAGFTLIELMIVIIGILAAIAIPQYADYTQRTKMAGAVSGLATYKTTVSLCIQDLGIAAGCNAGGNGIPNAIAGDAGQTINYVHSVGVADGVITMVSTANTTAPAPMNITMTPAAAAGAAAIQWTLSGTGCAVTTPGRGIKCSGN
jgi:type IV pilus assembly protein PilA